MRLLLRPSNRAFVRFCCINGALSIVDYFNCFCQCLTNRISTTPHSNKKGGQRRYDKTFIIKRYSLSILNQLLVILIVFGNAWQTLFQTTKGKGCYYDKTLLFDSFLAASALMKSFQWHVRGLSSSSGTSYFKATTYIELWKRRQAILQWEWDLEDNADAEELRPEYESQVKTTRQYNL